MPRRRLTTKTFVQKARAKHGDRYDYSRVVYQSSTTEIIIGCTEHKFFAQKPSDHLQGRGCRLCAKATSKVSAARFIRKAKAIHGDHYDYSQVEYKGPSHKVILICTEPGHNSFTQLPGGHLSGKEGCLDCRCAMAQKRLRKSQAEVIEEFKAVHGNRYNYDQVQYTGSDNHVLIECAVHGIYRQLPGNHKSGNGCPSCGAAQCAQTRRLTQAEFIDRAKAVHGNRYDYSNVKYETSQIRVTIKCPRHGSFSQIPGNHMQGQGCPICGRETSSKAGGLTRRISFSTFKRRAEKVHNDKYQYKNYGGTTAAKVTVVCPYHEEFRQRVRLHLQGQGCRLCRNELFSKNNRYTRADFVKLARKQHGNLFDYSKVEYVKGDQEVVVICKKHGPYRQKPVKHLEGSGCPACNSSQGERQVARWLVEHEVDYLLQWREHDCIAVEKGAVFDFWIPEYDVIVEFDGPQHFKPQKKIGKFHQTPKQAEAAFKKVQLSDRNKDDWAAKNNCIMIRIRYDEDVTTVLDQQLLPLLHD